MGKNVPLILNKDVKEFLPCVVCDSDTTTRMAVHFADALRDFIVPVCNSHQRTFGLVKFISKEILREDVPHEPEPGANEFPEVNC